MNVEVVAILHGPSRASWVPAPRDSKCKAKVADLSSNGRLSTDGPSDRSKYPVRHTDPNTGAWLPHFSSRPLGEIRARRRPPPLSRKSTRPRFGHAVLGSGGYRTRPVARSHIAWALLYSASADTALKRARVTLTCASRISSWMPRPLSNRSFTMRNSSSAWSSPFRLASTLFSAAARVRAALLTSLAICWRASPSVWLARSSLAFAVLSAFSRRKPSKSGNVTTTPTEYPFAVVEDSFQFFDHCPSNM